jgi:hypothetical protein
MLSAHSTNDIKKSLTCLRHFGVEIWRGCCPEPIMYSSYVVFTHMVDPVRGIEVPVGVALWSTDRKGVKVRMLSERERLTSFKMATDFPFVAHVHEKVNLWINDEQLPYLDASTKPWETKWWVHAKRLLVHRTRLSDPMPVEPSFDIDSLYESVVAPFVHKTESKKRVDGEISRCLSELASMMCARATVPGVGGRSVVVGRRHGAAAHGVEQPK